jgi:lipopolysaccharide/colanic/teichoic acid biosynthesis glycosyltransferase
MAGSGKRPTRLSPVSIHVLTDLLLPLTLIKLITPGAWLDAYTTLGLLYGMLMVLVVIAFRGYLHYPTHTIARKTRLVYRSWSISTILLFATLLLLPPDLPIETRLVVIWILIIPPFMLVAHLQIDHWIPYTVAMETRILMQNGYRFTEHESRRLEEQHIAIRTCREFDCLAEAIQTFRPQTIVLNRTGELTAKEIRNLTHLELSGLNIYGIHQFTETFLRKFYVDYDHDDLSHLENTKPYNRLEYLQKRTIDAIGSMIVFTLSIPVLLYSIVKIKQQSPGPVIYTQQRVGILGKEFTLYKLRSMHPDAETRGARFAEQDDPRAFPYGLTMRKSRIDEIPQLWNVLKGDLHLVGPRPERKIFTDELEKQIPYYHERHIIRPGMSGWSQVMYPYGSSVEDARQKLMYDIYYIKNWNIWLEFEVLIRTVSTIFSRKGL